LREELTAWAAGVESKYKGMKIKIDSYLGSPTFIISAMMGKDPIFSWTISDKVVELDDFMYHVSRYREDPGAIVKAAKELFPGRTLLGIVSEMTDSLVNVGTDTPRTFDVDDLWEGHTGDGHDINSSLISRVAHKYCTEGKERFTPTDAAIFESCERKIVRTRGADALVGDNGVPPIWSDLSEHGIYGLMWDKNDTIRTVTDVCC
jgi:hypothetical protein